MVNIENLKKLKRHRSLKKHQFFLLLAINVKIFKEEEPIKRLKIFELIENISLL